MLIEAMSGSPYRACDYRSAINLSQYVRRQDWSNYNTKILLQLLSIYKIVIVIRNIFKNHRSRFMGRPTSR